jgi:hypothetical protein
MNRILIAAIALAVLGTAFLFVPTARAVYIEAGSGGWRSVLCRSAHGRHTAPLLSRICAAMSQHKNWASQISHHMIDWSFAPISWSQRASA